MLEKKYENKDLRCVSAKLLLLPSCWPQKSWLFWRGREANVAGVALVNCAVQTLFPPLLCWNCPASELCGNNGRGGAQSA